MSTEPATPSLAVLLHRDSVAHFAGYAHPESPKRIEALARMVDEYPSGVIARPSLELTRPIAPQLVHDPRYLKMLKEECALARDIRALDEDTYVCKDSWQIATEGLSLEEQGIEYVMKHTRPCFVMTRPPGHHALHDRAMGFCLFANAAYAARYAQTKWGLTRVAVIDWDVHHGNGTEEIFIDDPSVYTISLHAHPFWPEGLGHPEERGRGKGKGYNLNIPVPFEAGDIQYQELFNRFVIPALVSFNPELIIVAAGFDAHYAERFSNLGVKSSMALSDTGFACMASELQTAARELCGGRLFLTLEGGYNLPSLTSGAKAVIDALSSSGNAAKTEMSNGSEMNRATWDDFIERTTRALHSA